MANRRVEAVSPGQNYTAAEMDTLAARGVRYGLSNQPINEQEGDLLLNSGNQRLQVSDGYTWRTFKRRVARVIGPNASWIPRRDEASYILPLSEPVRRIVAPTGLSSYTRFNRLTFYWIAVTDAEGYEYRVASTEARPTGSALARGD